MNLVFLFMSIFILISSVISRNIPEINISCGGFLYKNEFFRLVQDSLSIESTLIISVSSDFSESVNSVSFHHKPDLECVRSSSTTDTFIRHVIFGSFRFMEQISSIGTVGLL